MSPVVKKAARVLVPLLFFAIVAWLLQGKLSELDTDKLVEAVRSISAARIALAASLTAAAYLVLASYDQLAIRHVASNVGRARALAIAFVSYAFNFNIGAIAGGLGFRYRLYSKTGVANDDIAAIAVFSIVTNWTGCLTVLGVALLVDPSALERGWGFAPLAGRSLGALSLSVVAAYVAACRFKRGTIAFRSWRYGLPDQRTGLMQVGLASCFWLLVSGVIYVLGPSGRELGYQTVLASFAIASLAGLIIRIPAGLGVIEAVFIQIMGGAIGLSSVLAMLLAYRAIFLLAPLVVAALVLAFLEWRGARRGAVAASS